MPVLPSSETSLDTAGRWTPVGPAGGSIAALASHPQLPLTLYAGGWRAGVFKSEDGGQSWDAVGPTDQTVFSLAIDPKNPRVVYAGTYDGLFRSRDGGGSWSLVEQIIVPYPHYDIGPPAFLASAAFVIAFDPRNPTRVYLATVNDVFVSTDDGESFTAVQAPFFPVPGLAIDPASSSTLYAGTTSQGIFRSQDGGRTWKNILPLDFGVNAFYVDSSAGIYAVTERGIYQRASSGEEVWTPLGLPSWSQDMLIDPVDQTIYVAELSTVVESHDRGVSWTTWLDPDPSSWVNKLLPSRTPGVRLYAATNKGVIASSLDRRWHDSSRGLNGSLLFCLAVDDRSATLYAGTWYDRVHRSRDRGQTWERIEIGGDDSALQVLIDPRENGAVYVVTGLGAFQSHDGGDTWSRFGPIPPSGEIVGLAMAPSDPRTFYLTLGAALFGDRVRLFKTVDEGSHWDLIADLSHSVACLVVDPRDPGVVFLGSSNLNGTQGAGVMKSVDGGASWTGTSEGFPPDNFAWVDALTFDPSNPDVIYAATPPALFKSTDGGSHWARASTGLTGHYVLCVAVNPNRPSMVLAGTDQGAFVSDDAGQTWAPMNDGLIANASVRAIVFSPSEDKVRIATFGGGVFELLLTLRPSVVPANPPARPTTRVGPR